MRIALLLPLLSAHLAVAQDAPSTPRAALRGFLDAARSGRLTEAATFLGFADAEPDSPGTEAARRLREVIEARVVLHLDAVSDEPEGQRDDKLSPELEEVGRVQLNGTSEPLRMVRRGDGRWVFAPHTVERVAGWYEALPDRWIRDRVPSALLHSGLFGLAWWQWIGLPLLLVICVFLGRIVGYLIRKLIDRVVKRTPTTADDGLARQLKGPLWMLGGTLVARPLLPVLVLSANAAEWAHDFIHAVTVTAIFWGLLRAVDVVADSLAVSEAVKERPEARGFLELLKKAAKVALSIIAVLMVLQGLGYPAASIVAGLGIGGLAVALAAQKTIEHLFGGVVLGVDQPFRPGDLVKIDDLLGVVETVGLRSTRIRTPNRTTVTLPNGRLADMRIETFATRDRFRLNTTLNLVYSTTEEQLRAIVADLAATLAGHPKKYGEDPPQAHVVALGESSIDVEVSTWIDTTDYAAFLAIRQDLLLAMMAVVKRHGSAFAYPTRTLVQAVAAAVGPAQG